MKPMLQREEKVQFRIQISPKRGDQPGGCTHGEVVLEVREEPMSRELMYIVHIAQLSASMSSAAPSPLQIITTVDDGKRYTCKLDDTNGVSNLQIILDQVPEGKKVPCLLAMLPMHGILQY
jgi:hypothetical protein